MVDIVIGNKVCKVNPASLNAISELTTAPGSYNGVLTFETGEEVMISYEGIREIVEKFTSYVLIKEGSGKMKIINGESVNLIVPNEDSDYSTIHLESGENYLVRNSDIHNVIEASEQSSYITDYKNYYNKGEVDKKISDIAPVVSPVRILSQAEYDALTPDQKMAKILYVVE